jgi:hypothetical protein
VIELEANANDDPAFLTVAGQLIAGAALAGRTDVVTAVHIDHWFGDRWLGFRGKMLGIAGVRSWSLRGELGVPPFHPNRVHSTRLYLFAPESRRFEYRRDRDGIHGYRTSAANLNCRLGGTGLYAWYSGDTADTRTGAVMVYVVATRYRFGWYTTFESKPQWRLTKSVGISPRRVAELMELAEQPTG